MSQRRVAVDGDVGGAVIAGDHNVVVDAQHGSVVSVLVERERPRPVRRDWISLLPRRGVELLGRDAVMMSLAEVVATGGAVRLCGPPGVGKSTLLRHAAHIFPPGPDGVVFVSAAVGKVDDVSQEIFEACYDTAGYAPSRTRLRQLMTGLRTHVYLDDADKLTDEQLRELTDTAPDATFVIAGETRSPVGDATVLDIEGLDHPAALQLLARHLRRPLPDSEIPAATALWRAANGRPLLLIRAAALARPDQSGRPTLPRPARIADLVVPLLDQLDLAATAVVTLLATLPDTELATSHIAALTGESAAPTLCARLSDLGLTLPTQHGFRCAPDTVTAARGRHPDRYPADQLCAYFTWWIKEPTTTPADVAAAAQALCKVAELTDAAGRPDLVVQLTRSASAAMPRALRFGVWGRLLGLGWLAAQRTGNREAAAYFMHEEGIRNIVIGRAALAAVLLAEVAALWAELGHTHAATAALHAQHLASPTAGSHAAASSALHGTSASASHAAHGAATASGTAPHSAATHMAALTHHAAAHTATAQLSHAVPSAIASAAPVTAHSAAGTAAAHTFTATHAAATTAAGTAKAGIAKVLGTLTALAGVAAVVTFVITQHHTPTTTTDPLSGDWRDGWGNTVELHADGPNDWRGQVVKGDTNICLPLNLHLSGSDGHYTGTDSHYQFTGTWGTCGPYVGNGGVALTLESGGAKAMVTTTSDPNLGNCNNCGTAEWTKLS